MLIGPRQLECVFEKIGAHARQQVNRQPVAAGDPVSAERCDVDRSRIQFCVQEVLVADVNALVRLKMNEGEVAEQDQLVFPGLGRAHERELEAIEDVTEGQVEANRRK